jgi:hypothetical protein
MFIKYGELRVELSHRTPPIRYETDDVLVELCKGMASMAGRAMFANSETVELDQSVDNVMAAIDAAPREYLPDGQN